jgi:hypothetical protein
MPMGTKITLRNLGNLNDLAKEVKVEDILVGASLLIAIRHSPHINALWSTNSDLTCSSPWQPFIRKKVTNGCYLCSLLEVQKYIGNENVRILKL